jgi:hypothetical protein
MVENQRIGKTHEKTNRAREKGKKEKAKQHNKKLGGAPPRNHL